MDRLEYFRNGVKLIALYQATLEQMDTMKGTPLYRQSIRRMMNTLEKQIEQAIRGPLAALDQTDEELMTGIQTRVETILGLSLEELAALSFVIEEHREKDGHE